ncbi:pilin [Francisella marina]|uniref:Prepilin-type N-terminal cleavage/methylation domain-containing protein n=1 Tax=Francisella marina TaxID=2249302 RepID=A0ABX5ZDS9_9GAMM|nr:pilin [Francisella marina]QEO56385.1 prepilin-type N-terminal cleavage/methylation domain-containing protein [Francisella marina]QEO59498.1 prepilin-type N-terminal cleavage/methylation domain-containing protein [Francisella marina]
MINHNIKKGFSLVELMVVIAIIAILAAVAIPAYSIYVTRAKLTEALANLDNYKKDVQDFFISHGVSTEQQLQSFDVTDYTDIGNENANVMSDIVGHNGRIVGVSNINGKTYQIALSPSIENNTFKWTCSVSIVEEESSINDGYFGLNFEFYNNSGSYVAPSSSILPSGCNASSENQDSDYEAYKSQRANFDSALMNGHSNAVTAWQNRTTEALVQDSQYNDLISAMTSAESNADTAFSDYQKYQNIQSNQSNLDYYQGLIDNAADGVDTTSWQNSVDYYQGRIDSTQATMSSQAGSNYNNATEAAEYFNQQRDIYDTNRQDANARSLELQNEQRNVSSSINGIESQGFDSDYNGSYEQYNSAMDSLQSSVNSSVNVERLDTNQAEDISPSAFTQTSDKYSSWQYNQIRS